MWKRLFEVGDKQRNGEKGNLSPSLPRDQKDQRDQRGRERERNTRQTQFTKAQRKKA